MEEFGPTIGSPAPKGNSSINASSGTAPSLQWVVPLEAKIVMYFLYNVIFVFGTLGNGVVIFILGRKKRNSSSGDTFIVSLAFVDLLASIFIPMIMINDLATNFEVWHFGEIGCKLLPSINPLLVVAASWTLVAIAVDRYRLILMPFNRRMKTGHMVLCFAGIWSLAIGMAAPYFSVLGLDEDGFCWDRWGNKLHQFIYFCSLDIIILPVPLSIMVVFYVMCSVLLRESISKLTDGHAVKERLKQNKKVTKMFIIIVVTYFVLSTPYISFNLIDNYLMVFEPTFHAKNRSIIMMLNYGLFTLSATNACVNPLIYTKMHREVSSTLRSQLRRVSQTLVESWHRISATRSGSQSSSSLIKEGYQDKLDEQKTSFGEGRRPSWTMSGRRKFGVDESASALNSLVRQSTSSDTAGRFETQRLLPALHMILEENPA